MKSRRWLIRLIRFYPPFLGAGVRVRISRDLRRFDVSMRLSIWNRNYLGTHFGGSLYSMCDPFYLLILAQALGPGFVVWDKAAAIRFRRPGTGTVRAHFEISDERIAEIRRAAEESVKTEPVFMVEILNQEGEVVAEVEKVLYVRRRSRETGGGDPEEKGEGAAGATTGVSTA